MPHQPGYNKRLRRLSPTMLAVVDSTPIECARSRETVKRSDLAGWAEYGYCASHSRHFWGLRLHLQGLLALTAAIWHNDRTGRPVLRSLTAYDH